VNEVVKGKVKRRKSCRRNPRHKKRRVVKLSFLIICYLLLLLQMGVFYRTLTEDLMSEVSVLYMPTVFIVLIFIIVLSYFYYCYYFFRAIFIVINFIFIIVSYYF